MAIAALLVVTAGFANTYYLWPITRATHTATGTLLPSPTPPHVHAVPVTGWILLFVIQSGLGATRHTGLHRRLGITAVVLVPLMVLLGLLMGIYGASRRRRDRIDRPLVSRENEAGLP